MKKNLVIIPTYNEKENIEKIIKKVFSLKEYFNVLIIDDGSPDGTADIVKNLQNEFPTRLFILERSGKQGLGTAYILGFKWALKNEYHYIFEMDADFSHNPEDLVRLYYACEKEGFDVAIGSRYVQGVNVINWPMKRLLLSYFAGVYVRLITRMPFKDPTGGFICYSKNVLEQINLETVKFIGYAFQIEMKFRAFTKGFKMVEVPIVFTERREGQSKMSGSIVREAVFGVLQMKISSFFKK